MYGQGGYNARTYDGVSPYSASCPAASFRGGDRYETRAEATLKRREENRRTIETFVRRCVEEEEEARETAKGAAGSNEVLKICEAKESLVKAFALMSEVERLRMRMGRERSRSSDEEYTRTRRECSEIRELFERELGEFERRLPRLATRLAIRGRKRAREARMRAQRRAEKARGRERRARRSDEIDAWIREKRESLERERQVENLRKDADVVLADVRGKRTDARKFLGLLHELRDLRRIKVNVARARGENLPLAGDRAFDNIIDQLAEEWSRLDREYSIEEQGLKLMLKADNEEKLERRERSTFDEWEIVLFGKKLASTAMSLDRFLMTRHAWDKYANFVGSGSRVPVGWIIPVAPSSAAWQKCLKKPC